MSTLPPLLEDNLQLTFRLNYINILYIIICQLYAPVNILELTELKSKYIKYFVSYQLDKFPVGNWFCIVYQSIPLQFFTVIQK